MTLRLLLIACLLCLTACSDLSHLNDPDKTLIVEVAPGGDMALTEKILRKRFGAFSPSVFSEIDSVIEGNQIKFTFRRGAPSRADAEHMVTSRGVLTAKFPDGTLLYDDQDIEDAGAKVENGTVFLLISMKDESAARIGPQTEMNLGKAVDVVLDGHLLFRSNIDGRLWKRFHMSAQYPYSEIYQVAILLRYDSLPAPVRIVENQL
jgi:preprotein translocase subunit SecD